MSEPERLFNLAVKFGVCAILAWMCYLTGREHGLKGARVAGVFLSLFAATAGYAILSPLGDMALGAAVLGAVSGCWAALTEKIAPP